MLCFHKHKTVLSFHNNHMNNNIIYRIHIRLYDTLRYILLRNTSNLERDID